MQLSQHEIDHREYRNLLMVHSVHPTCSLIVNAGDTPSAAPHFLYSNRDVATHTGANTERASIGVRQFTMRARVAGSIIDHKRDVSERGFR